MTLLDLFFSAVVLALSGLALLQLIRYFRQWRTARPAMVSPTVEEGVEVDGMGPEKAAGTLRNLDRMYGLNQIDAAEYHKERCRLTETEVLQTQRDYLMQDLRDLELDHRMQKIDDADYHSERARLNPRALAIIKELATRQDRDPEIDA